MSEIPEEVASLAAEHQLGVVKGVFPAAKKRMLLIATSIFLFLFGGIAVAIDIGAVSAASSGKTGPPAVAMIVLNALGLAALAGFGWTLASSPVASAKARTRRIYWYDEGYVQVTKRGPMVVKWDEVVMVYLSVVKMRVGLMHHYRLTLSGGRKYTLDDNVVEMADFGPELASKVAQAQLPRAQVVLEQGKPVDFGPIVVTSSGISANRKAETPWAEVKGLDLEGGTVCISRQGKTFRQVVPVPKIPNLHTLLAIARSRISTPR